MSKEIEIIIPADGSLPSLEALNYDGKECTKDIENFIKSLGAKDVTKKRTADWYKKQKVRINQQII